MLVVVRKLDEGDKSERLLEIENGAYLFATSPKAFNDWPSKLKREGCLWGIRARDWIAGTCWADHLVLSFS